MLDKRGSGEVRHDHEESGHLNSLDAVGTPIPPVSDDLESELPF
jgi:hypothetical protein